MTRSSKGVPASAAPRRSVFQRRTEGSVAAVTESTSAAERSEVERVAAQGGLAALLYDALVRDQREAQAEESTAESVPANPELVAAIERSLLREKARRA